MFGSLSRKSELVKQELLIIDLALYNCLLNQTAIPTSPIPSTFSQSSSVDSAVSGACGHPVGNGELLHQESFHSIPFIAHLSKSKQTTAYPSKMSQPQEWYRDNYLISTSHTLLQHSMINDAFGSDDMFWTKRRSEADLKTLLEKSFCFGVYELPDSSSAIAGISNRLKQRALISSYHDRSREPQTNWLRQAHHR